MDNFCRMEPAADDGTRYIVFDLEWNQSAEGKAGEVKELPFEIIEIGAVKLDSRLRPLGEFSRFVQPVVYRRLHFKVLEIMHIGMDELRKRGQPFPEVFREFMEWCTEAQDGVKVRPVFCTWGNMDLTELQRNMAYYKIPSPFPYPLLYYDLQKLYNLLYLGNSKDKLPLDKAVEALDIPMTHPFHRAIDDARYTGAVMLHMDFQAVKEYLSLDYYRLPRTPEEEIYLVFPDYSKYVSREFDSRETAIEDKTVTDMICYRCSRALRKKIRWFTANQRNYYCLAWCPDHGFVRGKIRMKHSPDGGIFVVQTIKLTGEEGVEALTKKKEIVAGKRRKRNRQKHLREKLRGRT